MATAPIQQIVAATDFSPASSNGVRWAARLARAHGARLTLVHSVEPPLPLAEYAVAPSPELVDELMASAEEALALEAAEYPDLSIDREVVEGFPATAVPAAAQDLGADLVVTGTRGRTGLAHLLLGSQAERIVQRCAVPVLAVHPHDEVSDRPLRTILVPTDFSDDAEIALAMADRVLRGLTEGARVVLLHVYDQHLQYAAYGSSAAFFTYSEELSAALTGRLEEIAATWRRPGLAVDILLREGVPSQTIVTEAAEVEADLIAMGTHGRSGAARVLLGSTAERVVQRAPCPVLTVRRHQ